MSSPLCGLPVEVIGLISGFTAVHDLVAFCRTNQRIHSVCFRDIYRTVDVEEPARAVKCSETLASNIFYAQEVRKLKFLSYPKYPFRRFRVAFQSAMRNLENLETLLLYTHPSLSACLSAAHFPRLRQCSIPLGVFADSFLRRHPDLISLSVVPEQYHGDSHPYNFISSPPLLNLPYLEHFIGPEIYAFKVVPHSRVSHLSILWNTHRLRLNRSAEDIATLALSSTNIAHLENIVGIWDTFLLSAIAAGLPHLTSLEFRNVSPPDPDGSQIFISHLGAAIAVLPTLTSLSILQNPLRPPGLLDPRDLDREFATVRSWGAMSPTLRSAVLPSETAWSRVHVREDVWYPATKSPNRPDMLVRVKWFLRLVVSSPVQELGLGYARVAEAVAGKETLSTLRMEAERRGGVPEFDIVPTATGMSISITF
ncbi:hypothetical protein MVEN_01284200 [Mycena venus]|uniref:F-box domain-containing protein n=1 Tax=Mycena venus TaxID=2733690 RepID=A0A8H6Y0Z2_9AGAR|nr:hypothetical protein MVEN_01284200 [Mycena venus]